MVHFGEVLKTWSLRSNSVTRQVSFNRTKIGGKCPQKIKCDILSNFQTLCVRSNAMHLSTISLNKKCHALDQAMNLSDLPPIERKTGSESSTHDIYQRFLMMIKCPPYLTTTVNTCKTSSCSILRPLITTLGPCKYQTWFLWHCKYAQLNNGNCSQNSSFRRMILELPDLQLEESFRKSRSRNYYPELKKQQHIFSTTT